MKTCEVCNGKKYVHGAMCDRCEGTGQVDYEAPEIDITVKPLSMDEIKECFKEFNTKKDA